MFFDITVFSKTKPNFCLHFSSMASFNAQPETQILKILKLLTIVIAIIEKIGICRLPDVYNILLISETIIEI